MIAEFEVSSGKHAVHSRWLGDVEYDPDTELCFPAGMPGFEDERRILPIEIPAQRPLVYLQSLEHPQVCFATLPVFVVDPRFQLRLSEDERLLLELPEGCEPGIGTDVLCLALLISSGDAVLANLSAPVVVNLQNLRGIQCLPERNAAAYFRLNRNGQWESQC